MLVGALHGIYLANEKMGKSKGGPGGRIVNIASIEGLTVSELMYSVNISNKATDKIIQSWILHLQLLYYLL